MSASVIFFTCGGEIDEGPFRIPSPSGRWEATVTTYEGGGAAGWSATEVVLAEAGSTDGTKVVDARHAPDSVFWMNDDLLVVLTSSRDQRLYILKNAWSPYSGSTVEVVWKYSPAVTGGL